MGHGTFSCWSPYIHILQTLAATFLHSHGCSVDEHRVSAIYTISLFSALVPRPCRDEAPVLFSLSTVLRVHPHASLRVPRRTDLHSRITAHLRHIACHLEP
ncbi:hypothetical protein L226DRAFT_239402 [Lentinus tigrinus ALCF2SS1-7]|uniref:Secreted protein n=1 Tax=Lentinus tigrinus ALCF2SS1-6 TaxID=1328759 RepID=A0A5C2SQB0_9APHY|nr:hypothetical protein L227DRAFT_214645 [Lentinus tigrinus ALCF2SS1-6]RPD79072.1 hypothetical protein L226DRAFT_239402 [Lentinus tigrinus ALCF2SS1-7]